ncbi:hypothetical protein [Planococcus salinarum]|uniref:hypothetical protein n=1 Tax=Planococcus salinarum TaxID=622695 RepID=UPI0012B691E2|nr:hypothetical protein [Planococcus salinarum]
MISRKQLLLLANHKAASENRGGFGCGFCMVTDIEKGSIQPVVRESEPEEITAKSAVI